MKKVATILLQPTVIFLLLCSFSSLSNVEGQNPQQPNIILILTDDQDFILGGWEPMQRTRELIQEQGITMTNWFASTPVCCPSRGELLSGKYMHNIRDDGFEPAYNCDSLNSDCGCMRMNLSAEFEANTYPVQLQKAGYLTAYMGKYLNPPAMAPYCQHHVLNSIPPGWDHWYAMCNQDYFNVTWNDDGVISFTGDQPANYTTSILGNRSVQFIKSHLEKYNGTKPFHLVIAPRAPHPPFTPAPWYENTTVPHGALRTKTYGLQAVGHVPFLANEPPFKEIDDTNNDQSYRNRTRTLWSVDELVGAVVDTLSSFPSSSSSPSSTALDSTVIIFTSDHGFHLGQFRLPPGKEFLYDFDLRVPFVVRGPHVGPINGSVSVAATHVDLAPTLLEIAGVELPTEMDGKSVAPFLFEDDHLKIDGGSEADDQQNKNKKIREEATSNWREALLIEHEAWNAWPPGYLPNVTRVDDVPNNTYIGLRVISPTLGNLMYAELTTDTDWAFDHISFFELYDLDMDPEQIDNIYEVADNTTKAKLHNLLWSQFGCKGQQCN